MAYEDHFKVEPCSRGDGYVISTPWGGVVGASWDLYSNTEAVPIEVLRNPFPKELSIGLTGPKPILTKKQAEASLQKLRRHLRAVIEHVPKSKKIGASKFWK